METSENASRPVHLERLQDLFVKLLFCEQTRQSYCASPRTVLERYDLSPDYEKVLPDPDSENFKVEAHGRRMRVWKEAFQWFPKTIGMLDQGLQDANAANRPPDFNAFLSSDAFTDPARALLSPDGSGAGYENISKFFFWVRATCATSRPNADIPLRTTLHTEFAYYLITTSQGPCEDYYQQFQEGIRWRETPRVELPCYVMTGEFRLGRLMKASEIGPFRHLPDLDKVVEAGTGAAPNIM